MRERGLGWLLAKATVEVKAPGRLAAKILRVAVVCAYLIAMWLGSLLLWPFQRRGSLYLFYDLDVSPITFDFCWALAAAERLRKLRRLGSVRVVFVPGRTDGLRLERPDYEAVINKTARRLRLQNILLPAVSLLPSADDATVCTSRREATLLRLLAGRNVYPAPSGPFLPVRPYPLDLLLLARSGEAISLPLRSSAQAFSQIAGSLSGGLGERRLVTITLRDYQYMPARNSNHAAWAAFARGLDGDRYFPVVIPDTANADGPIPEVFEGMLFYADAARDLGIRMAVYESAYLNLMVNTGPHLLCMFNDRCRYLMFKILTESVPQTTEQYMRELGFEIGETPPFSTPYQKWVWEDDDLDVIVREFADMSRLIDASIGRGSERGAALAGGACRVEGLGGHGIEEEK